VLRAGIGNITAALRSTGAWEHTFIVFSAVRAEPSPTPPRPSPMGL